MVILLLYHRNGSHCRVERNSINISLHFIPLNLNEGVAMSRKPNGRATMVTQGHGPLGNFENLEVSKSEFLRIDFKN